MNKELFYGKILENVLEEIARGKSKTNDKYDKCIFAVTLLSHLNNEDFESIIDRQYLKITMTLTNALLLCNDLGVDNVEVVLDGHGFVLFHGRPNDLLNMLTKYFMESIECSIYNGGYSILVKHIDNDIIGKDE